MSKTCQISKRSTKNNKNLEKERKTKKQGFMVWELYSIFKMGYNVPRKVDNCFFIYVPICEQHI